MIMQLSMVILPGDLCGHGPLDLLTLIFCCQFSIFSPGWGIGLLLQFYSRIPKERPPGFVMHLAEMAGRENNERSIENVVLSHSLTYKESSFSFHVVDKCRLRPDFQLSLRQNQIVICVDLD